MDEDNITLDKEAENIQICKTHIMEYEKNFLEYRKKFEEQIKFLSARIQKYQSIRSLDLKLNSI